MKRRNTIQARDPAPMNRDPAPAKPLAKVIRLKARRCHKCGSTDLETHDSRANPAGVRIQHTECRACGARQIFIFD